MKKLVSRILLFLMVGLLFFLAGGIIVKKAKAEATIEKIRHLPDFFARDIMGSLFYSGQITSGPLLITFFHPECDHCKYEMASLCAGSFFNGQLKILLISSADSQVIGNYLQELEISDAANLYVVHDPDFKLAEMFGVEIIPSNYIYNDSLWLVKVFKGATKSEALLKYLNGND